MVSAALVDLRNRIASNTLTGVQQAALTQALTAIIPEFPTVDDSSFSVPDVGDFQSQREWISVLYTLQALAVAGGSSLLPTQQPAFFVNAVTGSDANAGTSAGAPLQTIAALAALWRGVSGGGRPVLLPAVGTTVTVTIQSNLPTSDPLAPILDVDLANGTSLIIVGGTNAPAKTSTLTTASAFARTAAAGQQTITDAATADFHPFVGTASLFVDSTTGAAAWLYAPDPGAGATGIVTVPYLAQTAGVPFAPAAPTAIAAGNAYSLAAPLGASLGQGFVTRSFPQLGAAAAPSQVFLYRLNLSPAAALQVVDFESPTVVYNFQECQLNHAALVNAGGVNFLNSFSFHNNGITASGGAAQVECLFGGGVSGQAQGSVFATFGGQAFVGGDFLVFSNIPYTATFGGLIEIANAGFWTFGAATSALEVDGGTAFITRIVQVSSSILYGNDGTVGVVANGAISGNSQILYRDDGSGTPATSQFQLTHPTFKLGDMTSPFGVTTATAAYVGPTTGTMAHLDAALAAGTGFGGRAVDNSTMCQFRIAA